MRTRTDALIIHTTATPFGRHETVASITALHKARGFSTIGYHFLIGLNGEAWVGRAPDNSVGAHVKGFNETTLGVSYVGGLDKDGKPKDTRTPEQTQAMAELLFDLVDRYPGAVILGHRDLSPDLDGDGEIEPREYIKMCPCFSAGPWAKSIGLPGGKYSKGKYVLL
jgi:N-acetylmuramoyl-L-alanine amidase